MSDIIADVAKGAAMGLPFGGPVGAAVGAAVGGLSGLLQMHAPDLLSTIVGKPMDEAVQAAQAAVQVVQDATGTIDPPTATVAAIDPDVEAKLRMGLAQVSASLHKSDLDARQQALSATLEARDKQHQAALSTLSRQLDDVADARRNTLYLEQTGSRMAWAPAIITGGVLAGFFALSAVILTRSIQESQVALVLVGIIGAMGKDCVSYWTGSTNAGSDTRRQLVQMAHKAADGLPPSVARHLSPDAPAVNVTQEVNTDRPLAQSRP